MSERAEQAMERDDFSDEIKRLAVAYSKSVEGEYGINHPYYAHHLQEALRRAGLIVVPRSSLPPEPEAVMCGRCGVEPGDECIPCADGRERPVWVGASSSPGVGELTAGLERIWRAADINLPKDPAKARTVGAQRLEEVRTVARRLLRRIAERDEEER